MLNRGDARYYGLSMTNGADKAVRTGTPPSMGGREVPVVEAMLQNLFLACPLGKIVLAWDKRPMTWHWRHGISL